MGFWPQQLNFALWCATTGCGISRQILAGGLLAGNLQVCAFYLFHVYFTTRRILFEMGGFQRISSLSLELQPNRQQIRRGLVQKPLRRIRCGSKLGLPFHPWAKPRPRLRFHPLQRRRLCAKAMAVPHAPFQPVEPKVLRLSMQQAGIHQKRPGSGPAVRVLCARQSKRFDPSRPRVAELVHRGFRLLHSGHAGQRSKQYCRRRRPSKRSAERVSHSPGGCNPNT